MEIPLDAQHDRFAVGDALPLISPLPSELQSRLHGLRASVHGQNHVVPEEGSDLPGEPAKDGVVERAGRKRELLGLFNQGGDYLGVTVPLVDR